MVIPEGNRALGRGLDVAVAVTYVAAQRLLVDGLFRR